MQVGLAVQRALWCATAHHVPGEHYPGAAQRAVLLQSEWSVLLVYQLHKREGLGLLRNW